MRKETAADYIDRADGEVRLILAELAESAGAVARSWSLAVFEAHRDPERANGTPHRRGDPTRQSRSA